MSHDDFSCLSLNLRPYDSRTSGSRRSIRIPPWNSHAFPAHFSPKVEFSGLNLRVSQSRVSFDNRRASGSSPLFMWQDLLSDWFFLPSFLLGSGVSWLLIYLWYHHQHIRTRQNLEIQLASTLGQLAPLHDQLQKTQEERTRLQQDIRTLDGARVAALTRLEQLQNQIAEERRSFEDSKRALCDTFRSLASEALAVNNTGFLTLAEEKFKSLQEEAAAQLDHRKLSFESLLHPLTESLQTFHQSAQNLEHQRLKDISAVSEQLRQLLSAQLGLQSETSKLVNALRVPHVRGRWGEIALRKTAELAGMSPHCDFLEQEHVSTETGHLRPDMVVKLPAGREVVVDAKVPLSAFLESLEAQTDEAREASLNRHVGHIRQHIHQLAAKEYWEQFPKSPDFVVLFIPNDSFLAAAAERDPSLLETALSRKVVLTTPTTFIALLRTIAYGWKQDQLAEEAERIAALGQELSDRMSILAEHVTRIGQALARSVDSYNAAVASLETRIFPTARKFQQLGLSAKKDIPELHGLDQKPRFPENPESETI